jgi:hypothetical protein
MPCGLTILFFVTALVGGAPEAGHATSDSLWRTVAQAELIVVGRLTVPARPKAGDETSANHGYEAIRVDVSRTAKGTPQRSISVWWYAGGTESAATAAHLKAFNGKDGILFLEQDETKTYFVDEVGTALARADPEFLARVDREVNAQREALRHVEKLFPRPDDGMFVKVKRLVDATVEKDTQAAALRDLAALDQNAVPAIIALMDDPRKLAERKMALRNRALDRFEEFRRYRPETVTDAMAAILNHITGEDFGSIYNGGSERERRHAVNGWRIYLSHLKHGINVPKSCQVQLDFLG